MTRDRFTRRRSFFSCFCAACFMFFGGHVRADVKLAGIFNDHMVLQQGVPLTVWGQADPDEAVTVTVGANTSDAKTEKNNHWSVQIAPLKASSEPVKFSVAGKNTISLDDVVVGEVWLASGQSNMELSLKGVANSAKIIADAEQPEIRFCQVGNSPALQPVIDRSFKWSHCTPDSAKSFSAVAYFFGRNLHDDLKVPIGLVGAYVAGTPAQSWTSEESLKSAPVLKHYLDELDTARTNATTQPSGKVSAGVPSTLYNGMIAPLQSFTIKGVIWYQGESNTSGAIEYRELFPALINGWRAQWNEPNLPFLFVQLPGFNRRGPATAPSEWALLREAQAMTLKLPQTAMAVTIDLSLPRQILHPKNKANVGRRLALLARADVYGEKVDAVGPTFQSMQIDAGKATIHFTNTAGGLMLGGMPDEAGVLPTTQPTELTGFEIASADHKFLPATATIDGDTVIVSSEKVPTPVAVRYGWANNPAVDLYNHSGLPAAPFRTDDWAN